MRFVKVINNRECQSFYLFFYLYSTTEIVISIGYEAAEKQYRAHNQSFCQRSLITETVTHISAVDSEFCNVENADPATDFSSLIQGAKDAVLILSVRKPCRNDKCSDLISLRVL